MREVTEDRPRAEQLLHLAGLGIFLAVVALWIINVRRQPDAILGHDWIMFQRVGQAALEGRWREIYDITSSYPFPYPPYAIYLCVPLGRLPPMSAYLACVASACALLTLLFGVLARLLPARPGRYAVLGSLTIASGPWLGAVITGQISPLFPLLLAAGFLAWRGRRPLLGGLCFSLLLLKPNLGLPVLLLLLWKREWRLAGATLLGAGALVGAAAPLGADIWRAYAETTVGFVQLLESGRMTMSKQLTIYSFWQLCLGPQKAAAVKLAWGASVAPLLLGMLYIWRGPVSPDRLPRLCGATALALVAANPYLFFYDGLLLAIPAAVWHLDAERYASRGLHLACGLLLGGIYLWAYGLFIPGVPLFGVGMLSAAWFLIEVLDLSSSATMRS